MNRGWKIAIKVAASMLLGVFALTLVVINWVGLGFTELKLLPALPSLVGCTHPQKYFVAFTSSAEARAIGGLIGQYAVVKADCTSIEITDVGTNLQLKDSKVFLQAQEKYPDIFLGENVEWVNSNLFPDGELVGSMWLEAFEEQTGQNLDGVIGVDLKLLVDLAVLNGFNFKTNSGDLLSNRNEILNYLLNGIYFDYPSDNLKRKFVQLEISKQLVKSLDEITSRKRQVLKLLAMTLSENRIFLYKPGISDNNFFRSLPIFYNLDSKSNLILIGANNLSGNKFDFYSDFKYSLIKCHTDSYVLDIDIKNNALSGTKFPDYVDRRLEGNPEGGAGTLTQILVILPKGTTTPTWNGPKNWVVETLSIAGGKTVVTLVGVVHAGENYQNSLLFENKSPIKILSWGHLLQVPQKIESCDNIVSLF